MDTPLFQSENVWIDRSIARIGPTTYPLSNISSVTVLKKGKPNAVTQIVSFVFFWTAISLWIFFSWKLALATGIVAIIVCGILGVKLPKHVTATVVLNTNSGEVKALQSTDVALVENVKAAIERAFHAA